MSGAPLLSVVVCTHQRTRHLVACLAGLAGLHDPVEVIVVDSASNPPAAAAVDEFRDRLPRLTYLYLEEPGLSVARNAGIEAASCPLVAFIDDDASPHPDWARGIVAGFADEAVACVGGSCLPAFEAPRPPWMSDRLLALAGVSSFGGVARSVTRSADFPFGANIAFRRDALQAVGGFDAELGRKGATLLSGEESAVVKLLLERGRTVRLEPAAAVRHTVTVERLQSSYYRRRLFWQGVTRARMGGKVRRFGGLLLEVPGHTLGFLRTRDRYYLYRAGAETAGHLAEWVRWTRWAS
jgi:glycosyltransferase involved in cell wall biosynthesis